MPTEDTANLTRGSLLVRNTIYGFLGQGVPLIIAVFSMPLLIKGLGTDRFGILTIAWMVISYFSLFDLGLGRALTQLVAEQLGKSNNKELADLIWTACLLITVLGLLGSLCVIIVSPWLVYSALKVPTEIQQETLHAFYLLAISIPIVTSSAGFVGVLSALQRFDLINLVKTPLSALMFLGPLLILPFHKSLVATVGILVALRTFSWLIYIYFCINALPALKRRKINIQKSQIPDLLKFGSWMTITNIIGPLMVYLDRFLIGGIISVSAVAYYTTPYEVVTKIWIIPGAIVGVLFPAFSASYASDYDRTNILFKRGVRYVFITLFPIICFIVIFAYEILDIWIGKEFARNSTYVLQWLAVGVLLNSLSQIPVALIQGAGRPDITAKIHLIELPIYLILVWWMLHNYGITGAAFAWFFRILVDTALLFRSAQFLLKEIEIFNLRIIFYVMSLSIVSLALAGADFNFSNKFFSFILIMIAFTGLSWLSLISISEKELIINLIAKASFQKNNLK
jgi:O-antigen/teichoic acid export membrane protein